MPDTFPHPSARPRRDRSGSVAYGYLGVGRKSFQAMALGPQTGPTPIPRTPIPGCPGLVPSLEQKPACQPCKWLPQRWRSSIALSSSLCLSCPCQKWSSRLGHDLGNRLVGHVGIRTPMINGEAHCDLRRQAHAGDSATRAGDVNPRLEATAGRSG